MLELKWKDITGKKIPDLSALVKELASHEDDNGKFIFEVGTDSQQAKNRTAFVTVIVARQEGSSGQRRVFWMTESVPRIKSLRERLMKEVWMSIDLGLEMNQLIPEIEGNLAIHIDANQNRNFKSGNYAQELASMVVGQGFKAVLKPDGYAAQHAADHVVKYTVLGR